MIDDDPNAPGYELRRARRDAVRAIARLTIVERTPQDALGDKDVREALEECAAALSEIPIVQAWLWMAKRILDGLLWLSVRIWK